MGTHSFPPQLSLSSNSVLLHSLPTAKVRSPNFIFQSKVMLLYGISIKHKNQDQHHLIKHIFLQSRWRGPINEQISNPNWKCQNICLRIAYGFLLINKISSHSSVWHFKAFQNMQPICTWNRIIYHSFPIIFVSMTISHIYVTWHYFLSSLI